MSTLGALSLVMLDHSMLLPYRQCQQLKEKADCVDAHLLQEEQPILFAYVSSMSRRAVHMLQGDCWVFPCQEESDCS